MVRKGALAVNRFILGDEEYRELPIESPGCLATAVQQRKMEVRRWFGGL
jgi:hypothetical protein